MLQTRVRTINWQPKLAIATAFALAGSFSAFAGTIDFDNLSAGTVLTSQYASEGVLFSGFTTEDNYFGGNILTVSPPDWVDVNDVTGDFVATATIDFVDPSGSGSPFVADSVSFTSNGLADNGSPGSYLDGMSVRAYDAFGNQVGVIQTIDPVNGTTGRSSVTLTFDGSIHELDFTRIENEEGRGADPLDNLVFGSLSSAGAPEPGTAVMCLGPLTL